VCSSDLVDGLDDRLFEGGARQYVPRGYPALDTATLEAAADSLGLLQVAGRVADEDIMRQSPEHPI
jgi:hypothetical protein